MTSPFSIQQQALSLSSTAPNQNRIKIEEWTTLCGSLPTKSLIAIKAFYNLIQESNNSVTHFLKDRANFPCDVDVLGETHKFYYCVNNNNSWRSNLRGYFKALKRRKVLEILNKTLEMRQASNEMISVRVCTPNSATLNEILSHNRRIVPYEKIPGKLAAASTFAATVLSKMAYPSDNQIRLALESIERYVPYEDVHVIRQRGGYFRTPLCRTSVIDQESLDILDRTTGHAYTLAEGTPIEDAAVATIITTTDDENNTVRYPLYCVFDGHGGNKCSKYLADNVSRVVRDYILDNPETNDNSDSLFNVFNFLKLIFVSMGVNYRSSPVWEIGQGSTATLVLRYQQRWFIACCGDSRAIRSKNGEAQALSLDAKPGNERDQSSSFDQDVYKRGKRVYQSWDFDWTPMERVMISGSKGLNLTRAVGHYEEMGINPRTKIIDISVDDISDANDLLIIASDGLWDVVNSYEAAKISHELYKGGVEPSRIAEALVKLAIIRNSLDNITVLVVDLSNYRNV